MPVPTLNLGHIHGGDNPNRICASCELHFDLRQLPGMDMQELRGEMQTRVLGVLQDSGIEVDFESLFEGIPAMETPANAQIVQLAAKLTGHTAEAVAFATEAPYLNQLGMESVILGPGDIAQAHTVVVKSRGHFRAGFAHVPGDRVGRLLQVELAQQVLEFLAVLGVFDRVDAGADDRHAGPALARDHHRGHAARA